MTAFTVVGVTIPTSGKPYHFTAAADLGLKRYDWVVVETVYGEQVGQVMETDVEYAERHSNLKRCAM